MKIEIKGLKELNQKLARLGRQYPEATLAALYQEGELIMTDSKRRIPVDTGTARDSGYVDIDRSNCLIGVGYGGPAAKRNPATGEMTSTYLIPLHERFEVRHAVGGPKFLENAANEAVPNMLPRLKAEIKRRMGG